MVTLWFSYSFPDGMDLDSPEPNRSPYHLTWHTGRFLRDKAQERGWEFRYVNLDDTTPYTIGAEDIVIGHPWFDGGCFIEQAFNQTCRAKIVLQPYTELMVGKEALPLLHQMWGQADWLFLTTGCFWWDTMPDSEYARYQHKATRLDNAVNPALHPKLKQRWNEPGKRAVLCIGYGNPIKGLDAVSELARVAGFKLLHLGTADPALFAHVPQFRTLSGMEFTPENIRLVVGEYDMFIAMGRYDANPTSLAETACWGLLTACTKESGYWANEPFVELRHDDMAHNLERMDWLQRAPSAELQARADATRNWVIATHTFEARNRALWDKVVELTA